MTEHIDRDALRWSAGRGDDEEWAPYVLILLDALEQAEAERDAARGYISELETAVQSRNDVIKHRDARISDLAQEARDERGAALDALAQLKLRDERIKAVGDVLDLDAPDPTIATRVRSDTIRRAIDGDSTNWK